MSRSVNGSGRHRSVGHAFAALVCFLPTAGQPATGGPRRASLSYSRADAAVTCPTRAELLREVERRLGGHPVVGDAGPTIAVVLSGRALQWRAVVRVRRPAGGAAGVRRLRSTATTCAPIGRAVALAVAMLIDPVAVTAAQDPSRAKPTEEKPPTAEQSADARPVTNAPGAANVPHWGWSIALGVSAAAGLMPDFSFGPVLTLGLLTPWATAIELSAYWWRDTADAAGAGSARYTAAYGTLGVCPMLAHIGRLELSACAVADLGWLGATGRGFDANNASENRWLLNLGAIGRASVRSWRNMFFGAALGLTVPLVRDRYYYEDRATQRVLLHRIWPAIPLGSLFFGGRFL